MGEPHIHKDSGAEMANGLRVTCRAEDEVRPPGASAGREVTLSTRTSAGVQSLEVCPAPQIGHKRSSLVVSLPTGIPSGRGQGLVSLQGLDCLWLKVTYMPKGQHLGETCSEPLRGRTRGHMGQLASKAQPPPPRLVCPARSWGRHVPREEALARTDQVQVRSFRSPRTRKGCEDAFLFLVVTSSLFH